MKKCSMYCHEFIHKERFSDLEFALDTACEMSNNDVLFREEHDRFIVYSHSKVLLEHWIMNYSLAITQRLLETPEIKAMLKRLAKK